MIHRDLATGAAAICEAVQIAEGMGELPAALPGALELFTTALAVTLLELRMVVIDLELANR
jgi:hypothetical protein